MNRFWKKVKRGSADECWEWLGARSGKGYGVIGFKGKVIGAHRLSFFLATFRPPQELCVCHTCDNPGCVNPDHLWLGTHKDNAWDMLKKGRHVPGPGRPPKVRAKASEVSRCLPA